MNKETFLHLVPKFNNCHFSDNSGRIYDIRLPLDKYDYNYEYAIIRYMEECGCVIHRTNWNFFGGFYIYFNMPTKYVCPTEYINNYKDRFYWVKNNCLLIMIFVLVVILIAFVIYGSYANP